MNPEVDKGGKWDGSRWTGTDEEWEKYWQEQKANDIMALTAPLTEEERERLREAEWAEQDPEVQDLYPDKYVAVYRRQIVASGDDMLTVMRDAERITGLPQGKVAITVIPGPQIFLWNLYVLPHIPIQEQRKDFMTDQARLARACHLFVTMRLRDPVRGPFKAKLRIDTAAPFSILPYSFWHDRNLACRPLGAQFSTLSGHIDPTALTWLGAPCTLGELDIVLLDEADQPTRPLRLVAKLPQTVLPGFMEKVAILGYNFLLDNPITLTVNPAALATIGNLANVVGFLTIR